jgi:mannitol/fructose-specific phosphotransferase system IIA component
MMSTINNGNSRFALDRLFQCDAIVSMMIGIMGIAIPHVVIAYFVKKSEYYNHNVHEVVRYVGRGFVLGRDVATMLCLTIAHRSHVYIYTQSHVYFTQFVRCIAFGSGVDVVEYPNGR